MAGLSDKELGAIVAQQISLAKTHDRTERATARDKALDYFFGEMDKYVPPEPNRSKVVSRDVADTMSRMMPGIMRVFTASGRMAIAEPVEEADVEFARQATEGLNYVFWKDNNGYGVVYSATWDALLQSNGIVKTWFDETPVYSTSFHSGLTEDQRALLLMPDDDGDGPEVLAQTERKDLVPHVQADGTEAMIPMTVYDLKIKYKKADGTFVVETIAPDQFLIDGDAIETADAAFTDHWQRKTRSDLVKMGYAKADVWAIPEAGRTETPEQASRDPGAQSGESTDMSMQIVDYHEVFIRVDVDGDGEAELVRACYGGGENGNLLAWEVWEDDNPFDDIKCEPVPHRWLARSVADEAIDVQDVKTVLSRQLLNNTYWANNPQRVVAGKVKNPDQLHEPTFGGVVFAEPNTTVTNLAVENVGEIALQGISYMDEVLARRTGVSQQTMALDPDALQNQTATAANIDHDASYSQVELIARNMAEWGWSKVFRKLLKLMVKHQDYARKVMFNGKPVIIDPRSWNADMHVTINVGLGTGSRDRDLAMLGQVLQSQLMLADRFMQSGAFEQAIDMLPKIIETMTKMAESAGIRNPEDFYPTYTDDTLTKLKTLAQQRGAQPPVQLQVEQMRGQNAQQIAAIKAQADQQVQASEAQSNIVRAQAEATKAQADAAVKQAQAAAQARESELQGQLSAARLQIDQLKIAATTGLEKYKAELAAAAEIAAAQAKAGFEQQASVLEAALDDELANREHARQMQRADQAAVIAAQQPPTQQLAP